MLSPLRTLLQAQQERRLAWRKGVRHSFAFINERRCQRAALYGHGLRRSVAVRLTSAVLHDLAAADVAPLESVSVIGGLVQSYEARLEAEREPPASSPRRSRRPPRRRASRRATTRRRRRGAEAALAARAAPQGRSVALQPVAVRQALFFPDKRLVQWDCGKLQVLHTLLRQLHSGGHRCLIFTQMTKMLDILETWINICGYSYLRLDGATKTDERQKLMDRYNLTPKIFIFILATRAGGHGIVSPAPTRSSSTIRTGTRRSTCRRRTAPTASGRRGGKQKSTASSPSRRSRRTSCGRRTRSGSSIRSSCRRATSTPTSSRATT